mmetsp:Transcript_18199/g.39842  ORF Transcript_18199/g.39842 Transcript_18199/m.39842 type:complete len:202 (+) Transcript_18199:264-869(+)
MSHTTPRRRSEASDEGHHGLLGHVVLFQPLGGILLCAASNLPNHDDAFCLGIVDEALEAIDEVGAVEGVTADANAGGLPEAGHAGLVHSLVGERTRATDDANLAWGVDVARHDPHLALTGLDDAWAVRPDEAALVLPHQRMLHLHHVLLRNTLADADNQWNLRLQGLHDCRCCSRGWHVDDGRVAPSLLLRLHCILEDGQV